jgi:type 1 glutamine amidotransferase
LTPAVQSGIFCLAGHRGYHVIGRWHQHFVGDQKEGDIMKFSILVVVISILCFGCVSTHVDAPAGDIKTAVVTGGHGFNKPAFLGLFEGHADIGYVHVPQKDHSELFEDITQWPYDVIVLYNMTQEIPEKRRRNFVGLLDQGVGLVVLHHAIAAYQAWPEFQDIIGARYFLEDTTVNGVAHSKSGYQHDVDFTIKVEDRNHPITLGLSDFRVHDETYNNWFFAPGNHLLLSTDHPASDKPVCWVRTYRNARVCHIQIGHGPSIFADENYRRLVAQSIRWTAGRLND